MTAIMLQDETINRVTAAYIDDIYINEDIASLAHVKGHFTRFGLMCKDPECLENSAWVLVLQVEDGSAIPEILDVITRWNVFSMCRKLVGYFPACGWLCVAMVVIKHTVNAVT